MGAKTCTIKGAVSHRKLQPGEVFIHHRERYTVVSHDGYTLSLRQPVPLMKRVLERLKFIEFPLGAARTPQQKSV